MSDDGWEEQASRIRAIRHADDTAFYADVHRTPHAPHQPPSPLARSIRWAHILQLRTTLNTRQEAPDAV